MKERTIRICGCKLVLRKYQAVDVTTVSVILESGEAYPDLYTWRRQDDVIFPDEERITDLIKSLIKVPLWLRITYAVSSSIKGLATFLKNLLVRIYSGLVGFGPGGLFLLLVFGLYLLALLLLGYVFTSPFLLINRLINRYFEQQVSHYSDHLVLHAFDFMGCFKDPLTAEKV